MLLLAAFPAASFAVAVSVCAPLAILFVFHANESDDRFVLAICRPSANTTIEATPTLSLAVTLIFVLMLRYVPFHGFAIFTVGGVVSLGGGGGGGGGVVAATSFEYGLRSP